ncbi:MAG: DNA polymerase IV [Alphaproteobacteria bacterium]
MSTLCRSCLTIQPEASRASRCPECGGRRQVSHPELESLAIAHIDCDAFYAAVEKRDRPELRDQPVIIGGGRRGVVATACYVARLRGVRSAMPMFQALKACPDAVVIRPEMAKYQKTGRRIREMMLELTPLVEPLSIDEAFLDLSGTEALHGGAPAKSLAKLLKRIEHEVGLTASVGLSFNKFLAKVASEIDKPRGFAVIGRTDAPAFLASKPVGIIWGVGKALRRTLEQDGIVTIADVLRREETDLVARYGAIGRRLYRFARGKDDRPVDPVSPMKSISSETTFDGDIADPAVLLAKLWPLCETVSRRLKQSQLAGRGVTLKLKTADFKLLTRSRRLSDPTCLAETIYRAAQPLLEGETTGRKFRLIGIGASDLVDGDLADPPNLLDPDRDRQARVEKAIDAVRARLGETAIGKGRGLVPGAARRR